LQSSLNCDSNWIIYIYSFARQISNGGCAVSADVELITFIPVCFTFRPLPPDEIVGNALMKIGEVGYNLLYQNCEHFATWCRYGRGNSDQAEIILTGLNVVTTIAAAAGLVFSLVRGGRAVNKRKRLHSSSV
jgi:hypothetical protein